MSAGVCLFTDSLEPSGVGEHMLALAVALRRRYRLAFVCPPTRPGRALLARAAALGVEHHALEADAPDAGYGRLLGWLAERRPDLVHVHAGIGWEGHAGCRTARTAGVPVVLRTEHLPDLIRDPDQRREHRRTVAAVDGIICVSEAARDSFRQAGVPAAKLKVVRNGIAPHPCAESRVALRERLGLPPAAPVVLTVGRMTEQKGHRYLAQAIPAVLGERPDALFLWVGSGPLEQALRRQVAAFGVERSVRFLGQRDDVGALLAASDLFVLPSRFEGLPLVVLEAMAAALPVVGTRVCGIAEVVDDGVTGRLVEPESGVALARAIGEVVSSPARAAEWGAAGRRRVAGHFTAARMARETAAIYDELLATRRAIPSAVSRNAPVRQPALPTVERPPRSLARQLGAGE